MRENVLCKQRLDLPLEAEELNLHIEQSNVDSYLVIMKSDVMDDENVISVPLNEAEHEFTINDLEGDE